MKILTEHGYSLTITTEHENGIDIKKKLCYIVLDYEQELVTDKNYDLPGGQAINIASKLFCCPVLYQRLDWYGECMYTKTT